MSDATSDRDAIQRELEIILRRVFNSQDFVLRGEMVTGAHPAWNSIANVEILISCEERWNLIFTASEIDRIRSLNNLVDAIASHV